MGGKKKARGGLGSSLIKDRFGGQSSRPKGGESYLHTSELDDGYDWGRLNLQSVTDQTPLEDFLATAELAGTEFTAEKLNVKFVDPDKNSGLLSAEEKMTVHATQERHKELLKIPRRPYWDSSTTPEVLDQKERDSFLDWRRQLAQLQEVEHIVMTPFERNIDFWRQLWRVIERSDIIVQIVDARNPLLFRCEDLEKYVMEVDPNKINLVLINKADLLTPRQREIWAEYFDKTGMRVAFWSALQETEKKEEVDLTEDDKNAESDSEDEEEEDSSANEEEKGIEETSKANEKKERERIQHELPNDAERDLESEVPDRQSADSHTEESSAISQHSTLLGIHCRAPVGPLETADSEVTDSNNVCDDCVNTNSGRGTGCPQTSSPEQEPSQNTSQTVCVTADSTVETENSVSDLWTEETNVSGEKEETPCLSPEKGKNDPRLLSGEELISLFKNIYKGPTVQEGVTTVGMVGYPNVGKSSTINAILQTKKVPVSATPGRTKHFQTLYVDPALLLCDCPGLVMPTFVSTQAEMVVCGILPIDQMRDYVPPVSLLCTHIPRETLENVYGLILPRPIEGEDPDRPPTAHEFLAAYGYMRGFMTHKGIPDYQRSARHVLKDYVNGKLLYCYPPLGVNKELFEPSPKIEPKPFQIKKLAAEKSDSETQGKKKPQFTSEVDRSFFGKARSHMGSKGVQGVKDFTRVDGFTRHVSAEGGGEASSAHSSMQSMAGKPWKKHHNKRKKEKLRRLHADLDA